MRVGVTLRVVETAQYKETRDAISHDWISFLTRNGITPVLIPNQLADIAGFVSNMELSAVLLTNGNNVGEIDACTSNQKLDDVSSARNKVEKQLVDFALRNAIPILGICRGMQFLNVYFGGTLLEDLSLAYGPSCQHVNVDHEIEVVDTIHGESCSSPVAIVNSYHNQGVSLNTLAGSLRPFALAKDVVEGLYHPGHAIIGIQWHPERQNPAEDLDSLIIRTWLNRVEALCI